ncbi:hypothetical protein K438DRAFT_1880513 [Mycena galopus ATCC 62051]|nr:hypothetical protein K438DRAFT_1880513 [Mycena galopus ATCC 62051]
MARARPTLGPSRSARLARTRDPGAGRTILVVRPSSRSAPRYLRRRRHHTNIQVALNGSCTPPPCPRYRIWHLRRLAPRALSLLFPHCSFASTPFSLFISPSRRSSYQLPGSSHRSQEGAVYSVAARFARAASCSRHHGTFDYALRTALGLFLPAHGARRISECWRLWSPFVTGICCFGSPMEGVIRDSKSSQHLAGLIALGIAFLDDKQCTRCGCSPARFSPVACFP